MKKQVCDLCGKKVKSDHPRAVVNHLRCLKKRFKLTMSQYRYDMRKLNPHIVRKVY